MAETYCGKTCLDCGAKELLQCPGCRVGPGRQYDGDCELAKCCRSKGHQQCADCGFRGNCGTLRLKDRVPEFRRRSMDAEAARLSAMAERAPMLGKWLWVLFWLIIPSTIASVLTNENIAGFFPGVFRFGQVLSVVCAFIYGVILLRLSSGEERYRWAGICGLIGGAVNAVTLFLSGGSAISAWTLLITIPAAIAALVGEYNEFTAHSIVLAGVDNDLSWKWSSLWKWYIGAYCTVLGSLLIYFIIPVLGLLVTLAATICLFVVSILKLVYLYRTASVFRSYSEA